MAKSTCKHFEGDRPCKYYWTDRSYDCEKCSHNSPIKEKILLIKLDAIGDVIRATPLAEGLKKKYPNSLLTWLVGVDSYDLLKGNANIDKVVRYGYEAVLALRSQKFDIIINLDKAHHAAALAMQLDGKKKLGYGLDDDGMVFPLNEEANYHYNICLDNWGMKSKNEKTYQEMIFDIAGLNYDGEEYTINLPKHASEFASKFLDKHKIKPSDVVIGLNTGCGPVYPHKKWTLDNYIKLTDKLNKEIGAKVLLFGSSSEVEHNSKIYSKSSFKSEVIDTTGSTNLVEFASLINLCDVLVTGDTAGMHLAIAFKKPVVALFGPTPAQEIEMYGRGIKIVGKVDCLNCYDQFHCSKEPNCMETITVEEVFKSVKSLINK